MASTSREAQLKAASDGMLSDPQPLFFSPINVNEHAMDEPSASQSTVNANIPRIQDPQKKAEKIRRLRSHLGAQQFIETYYITLNGTSLPLRNFYASSNTKYTSCANPVQSDITINGLVLTGGPDEYERMIKAQRQTPSGIETKVRYEVEGWDVHILNPEFTLACPENLLAADGTESKPDRRAKDNIKASLLLQVTGMISYGSDKEAPKSMFNDVFVLVPNWDTHVKNPPRNARRWLIMSQNFRAL